MKKKRDEQLEAINKEIESKQNEICTIQAKIDKNKGAIIPFYLLGGLLAVIGLLELILLGATDSWGVWAEILGGAFLIWIAYSEKRDESKGSFKIALLRADIDDLNKKLDKYKKEKTA